MAPRAFRIVNGFITHRHGALTGNPLCVFEDGAGLDSETIFAASGANRTLARFFFPQNGAMREDLATGSATANFGGWCVAMGGPLPLEVQILSG